MRQYLTKNPSYLPSGEKYRPEPLKGITYDEYDFLKAYLNGHHDNNYLNCHGCPSSSGTDTVVRHSVATTTLKATAGSVAGIVTGIPEAPLMLFDGTDYYVIPYSNAPNTTQSHVGYTADFLKAHGVGRYRCASLSVKITDITPQLYQKGTICAVRNPSAIDLVPVNDGTTVCAWKGLTQSIRVVEEFATSEEAITGISANNYIGPSSEGLYSVLPYLEPLNPYIDRDSPENKAVYSLGTLRTDINSGVLSQANVLGSKSSGSPDLRLHTYDNSGTPVTLENINLIPCSKENMQTLMFYINGVDPVNATYRISVVSTWEYVTSTNSDWADLIQPPMPTNIKVLQAASEVFRGMPAAYPASANSWNEIWDRFKNIYSSYVEPVATKVIQNLPPNYAPAAATIKGLLDTVTDTKKSNSETKKEIQEVKALVKQISRPKSSRR